MREHVRDAGGHQHFAGALDIFRAPVDDDEELVGLGRRFMAENGILGEPCSW